MAFLPLVLLLGVLGFALFVLPVGPICGVWLMLVLLGCGGDVLLAWGFWGAIGFLFCPCLVAREGTDRCSLF